MTPAASGTYNEGATVTITATPEEGYKFERWEGSDFDDNPCNFSGPFNCRTAVTMRSDRDVEAFFLRFYRKKIKLPFQLMPNSLSLLILTKNRFCLESTS